MIRIFKNKTAEEVSIRYENTTVIIAAASQSDLATVWAPFQLAACDALAALLGQGADKYQLNDGADDLTAVEALDLIRGYQRSYPVTDDGKQIFLPSLLEQDEIPNFTGAGDDIANGARFNGNKFQIHSVTIEDKAVEASFTEWLSILGGYVIYNGAVIGDYICADTYSPANVGTSNPGAGAYRKQIVGAGRYMYIPQVNGDWDLNLTEKWNANVPYTKLSPVPVRSGVGFFDLDFDTYALTVKPDGTGGFNLFDFELRVNRFMNQIPMLGTRQNDFIVSTARPKYILPQWRTVVTVHNSTEKTLDVVWSLYIARRNTT
jgi:hypothetical protein